MFKVRLRKKCLVCKAEIVRPSRYRIYCSKKCRQKSINKRYYAYQLEWSRKKRGEYSPDKLKCGICGRYYVQVGSHIVQKHKMTAREYREEMNLPVKCGITPKWFRDLKGKQCKDNGTVKNLKKGKKFWYKKNDKRAKTQTFWKSHRRESDEYYVKK